MTEKQKEISGKTLKVFIYIVKKGPAELKDIQRSLSFSTASLASYHVGKLVQLGYVYQDNYGRYVASDEAAKLFLEDYSKIGNLIVPEILFFAVLFTVLISYFSYFSLHSATYIPFLIASSLACVLSLWYQTIKIWRKLSSY